MCISHLHRGRHSGSQSLYLYPSYSWFHFYKSQVLSLWRIISYFLSSASLSHTLLHLLSPPKDLYSLSFLSNWNLEAFPLIPFLQSQGFFLLPSSFPSSLIPLSSPQLSIQWVNYAIKIRNYLHSPTFFQLH